MAGWTDYADWTSAATLKLTASYDIFSGIVSAVNERIVFFNKRYQSDFPEPYGRAVSLIDVPEKLDIYDYRKVYKGYNELWHQYLNYISDQVFGLANGFTNPNLDPIVNGMPGYFVEGVGMLQWKESAILSAIGDSERYIVQKNDPEIPAAWAFQMYKVLNLLRYVSIRLPDAQFFSYLSLTRMNKTRNFYYETLPDALIDFIAANYVSASSDLYFFGAGAIHITEPYRYVYTFYADILNFISDYDLRIYGTEYRFDEDRIQPRKADYWGLGTNKGMLVAECVARESYSVAFPYPNLDLLTREYVSSGYTNGLYFGAIIDGQSGENGFEFFDESA